MSTPRIAVRFTLTLTDAIADMTGTAEVAQTALIRTDGFVGFEERLQEFRDSFLSSAGMMVGIYLELSISPTFHLIENEAVEVMGVVNHLTEEVGDFSWKTLTGEEDTEEHSV